MNRLDHLVLHGIGIKKYSDPCAIAGTVDLPEGTVRGIVERVTTRQLVADVGGRFTLTPAGRLLLRNDFSRHFAAVRSDAEFVAAYHRFEAVNVDLKALITSWQVRPIGGALVPNDHSDKAYDDRVVDRLGELHEKAERILAAMTKALPRMHVYQEKLMAALERAEDGEIQWVSDAKIESYHTVWFELHEDLLCMLGHERQE